MKPAQRLPEAQIETARDLWRRGHSRIAIALRLGACVEAVIRALDPRENLLWNPTEALFSKLTPRIRQYRKKHRC